METEDPISKLIRQSLADPETLQILQEDVFAPLIQAARDPRSKFREFLSEVGACLIQYGPVFRQKHEEFQKADARADQLLKQMQTIKLNDFLRLDPIDPLTLLLIAEKVSTQSGVYAKLGQKMSQGRKKGTLGPAAKAVAKHLQKHPTAKAAEIWESLAAKPPKGLAFRTNRSGQYIEYFDKKGKTPQQDTSYKRFCNIVSEQRKLLQASQKIPE